MALGCANGNQISVETPSGEITTYSWSYENQLIQTEHPDDTITTQTYAPVTRKSDELRYSKETEAGLTQFLWDNQNIIQEVDDLNTIEAEYTLNPHPYGDLVSQRREDESTFYNYDALGSTESLTDESATVTDQYLYSAFGKILSQSGNTENKFSYVGKLQYYRNDNGDLELHERIYRTLIDRFLSEDPVGFAGPPRNLYTYVHNSPANRTDPSGLDSVDIRYPLKIGSTVFWVSQEGYDWFGNPRECARVPVGKIVASWGFTRRGDKIEVELFSEFGGCTVELGQIRNVVGGVHSGDLCHLSEAAQKSYVKWRLNEQLCQGISGFGHEPPTVCDAFFGGLQTGAIAAVNGTATAIVRTVTLGFCDREIALVAVSDEDRAAGYDTAVAIATASGEVLIAVITGGAASALAKGGRVGRVAGLGLVVFDTAGNVVGVVRGSIDALTNGLTLQNGIQITGSLLGAGGNTATLRGMKFGVKEAGSACSEAAETCPIPPRTPPVTPPPDDLPKGQMPPLNDNGFGLPHGVVSNVGEELRSLKLKGWRKGKGRIHIDKHGKGMGFNTLKEYTEGAIEFAKKCGNTTEVKVGNLLFKYDFDTEWILIVSSKERTIVTFYKADDGFNSFLDALRVHLNVL